MTLGYTWTKEPTHFTTVLLQAAVSTLLLDTRQIITPGADFCECIQLLQNAIFNLSTMDLTHLLNEGSSRRIHCVEKKPSSHSLMQISVATKYPGFVMRRNSAISLVLPVFVRFCQIFFHGYPFEQKYQFSNCPSLKIAVCGMWNDTLWSRTDWTFSSACAPRCHGEVSSEQMGSNSEITDFSSGQDASGRDPFQSSINSSSMLRYIFSKWTQKYCTETHDSVESWEFSNSGVDTVVFCNPFLTIRLSPLLTCVNKLDGVRKHYKQNSLFAYPKPSHSPSLRHLKRIERI